METVEKKREPMPAMEAIYLITPTVNSIKCLMNDFQVRGSESVLYMLKVPTGKVCVGDLCYLFHIFKAAS